MNSYVNNIIDSPFFDSYSPPHQNGPDYIIPAKEIRTWQADGSVKIRVPVYVDEEWKPVSLVTCFNKTVNEFPNNRALVVKRNTSLVEWTWADFLSDIQIAAKGFIKLGLLPFHGVAMLGFNAPEWVISYWAGIFSGGLSAGIYTTNSSEACFHILNDCSANIVVVENDDQLQKILCIRNTLPHLKAIIQYMGKPLRSDVLSWEDLLAIGRSVPDDTLTRRIKGLAINQCCCIIYTSGTTGNSKGVMLSQDNLVIAMKTICKKVWRYVTGKDNQLSYLALSHIGSLFFDLILPIHIASCVHFPQPDILKKINGSRSKVLMQINRNSGMPNPMVTSKLISEISYKEKLLDNLTAVRPDSLFAVPRTFEKISEAVTDAELGMKVSKRNIFRWARKQALSHHLKPNGSSESLSFLLAKKLVLNDMKRSIGLENARTIIVGGAPLSDEVQKFFLSLDICFQQAFGLSESTAGHIINVVDSIKIGTCGRQDDMPNFESAIENSDESGVGEILLRGRNIFMGYLNDEEKTLQILDDEGWLHTGDTGRFDNEGYLFVTGRIKELVITSGGENIPPLIIEQALKKLIPAVSNCMVVGDGRKYLTILITLKSLVDPDTMYSLDQLTPCSIAWCRSVGSTANTVSEIINTKDSAAFKGIQDAIDVYNNNKATSHSQRLQKWRIIPKDFSIPTGELTATTKMRRPFIATKYSSLIDVMYSEE